MPDRKNSVLAFGPFLLFPEERRLEKEGNSVRLGGRALDLLVFLVERAGEVVSNRTLLESVWGNVNVEEGSLRFHIKNLRRVLGDGQLGSRYVTNVPGRGYCFVAHVAPAEGPGPRNPSSSVRVNLPARGSAIIGRSDSIDIVSNDILKRRFVTIAGPAGIGKTTLAIAAAENLRPSFDDAILFVDLAPIEDPSLVVSTVASGLGVALRSDEPVQAIVDFLRDRRLLVVLDNCEQVIEAVAGLVDRLFRVATGTHLLVTSRETLRIAGERVYRLMPLECPPVRAGISALEAMAYPAVQLFVDRATASAGSFSLDDEQAPAAAEICRRLDGIPFAIELAAARVEFFGVAALARGLNDMFALLTQGRRFALPRHRTLRATLDWGYNLLTPSEQRVLRCIAIFRAPFSLEAALAVVVGSQVTFADAVNAMASLVAKSLLTAHETGGTAHYRLLEATRLYASEKLAASQEGEDAARRHAEYHLNLFRSAQDNRKSNLGEQWIRQNAGRIDDVRAAIDWAFSPGGDLLIGSDLTTASAQLWFHLSLTLEYRERIQRALQRVSEESAPDAVMEMRLLAAMGHALWYTASDPEKVERAFTRALELADRVGDVAVQLQGLWGIWAAKRARGRYREALAVATKYEGVARATGDEAFMLLGDRILGLTHHYLGNHTAAREKLEQVIRVARYTRNAPNTEFQLAPEVAAATVLTRVLWLQGLPDQAAASLRAGVDAAQQSDHWFSLYYVLCFAGCPLALWTGNLAAVQTYLDLLINRAAGGVARACWTFILRLRRGDERDALIAAFLEPRLDMSTFSQVLALASAPAISVPWPDDDVGDALWSLPEVLRVNAELLLWHGVPDAAAAAEAKLLCSLDLAQQKSALSWELRSATSLARLWHRGGRTIEARRLLTATCDRFTEGFDTGDVVLARRLVAEWS